MTPDLIALQRAAQDCGEPGMVKGTLIVMAGWLAVGAAVWWLYELVQPVWSSFQ